MILKNETLRKAMLCCGVAALADNFQVSDEDLTSFCNIVQAALNNVKRELTERAKHRLEAGQSDAQGS